jgi:hypothetical protein
VAVVAAILVLLRSLAAVLAEFDVSVALFSAETHATAEPEASAELFAERFSAVATGFAASENAEVSPWSVLPASWLFAEEPPVERLVAIVAEGSAADAESVRMLFDCTPLVGCVPVRTTVRDAA